MKTRFSTLLATALLCTSAQTANAAEQSRHSHEQQAGHEAPGDEHSKHDHASHEHTVHAHSTHEHDAHEHAGHGHGHGHGHAPQAAGHAAGQAPPVVTEAERRAAFPDLGRMTMADHGMDDEAIHFKALFDKFEWRQGRADEGAALGWKTKVWIGRDIDKFWLESSGERRAGRTESAHLKALWGHAISPWWESLIGLRHDTRPDSQTRLALGLHGMTPYKFELEAMLYLGRSGHSELHLELEYELLLSQRWILVPHLATGAQGKSDAAHGLRRGWSGLESGLQLRYEIRPDLAPYIGYVHEYADRGPSPGGQWVAGLRFWF